MPFTSRLQQTMGIGSVIMQGDLSKTQDGAVGQQPPLPAGFAGVLTTRDADDEGHATLVGTHGLLVDDMVDVYWATGIRYGMKVTAVNGQLIDFGGVGGPGAGDALPAATTPLIMTKRVEINIDFTGNEVHMMGMSITTCSRCNVEFTEEGGTTIATVELTAGELWFYVKDIGMTNVLAAKVVGKMQVSNGESVNAGLFKFAALLDSAT